MSDKRDSEETLLNAVKQQLDISEQTLSADELRSLRLARAQAMEALNKPKRTWQPIAAVATAASVVAIVIGLQGIQTARVDVDATQSTAQSIEDLSLLSATDELEFYEDLEFYQWLEFEDRAG